MTPPTVLDRHTGAVPSTAGGARCRSGGMSRVSTSPTNALLGYPDDARLLLINADDFGMYAAINEAVVPAYQDGIVRSTSLMVPCPGADQAIRLLRANPDLRFGVHLSVVRDIASFGWNPLTPKERVPSLLDADGYLYHTDRTAEFLERAKLVELEIEFRAQIGAVLAADLRPTHLDWHCLDSGGRADIFEMTFGLANEHGLALRVASHPFIDQVRQRGLPTNDHDLLDSFRIDIDSKPSRFADLLRTLPPGLTEWAVHPSLGDPESQTIEPDGWRVRRSDFAFLVSAQARQIVEREGIILIGYEPIQRVWRDVARNKT